MKIPFYKQIQQMNKIDTFSPYFFLPFILVLYFFTSLFDFYRFEYFGVQKSVWPSIVLALASYYLGVFIVDKKKWTLPKLGMGILQGKSVYLIWILAVIGLGAYMTMLFTGQIGLVDESVRRNLDPKLNLLSQLLWFSLLLLLSLKIIKEPKITFKKAIIYGSIYGLGMVLFILMGYRTPIIIMLFTALIIFHYVIKRIKLTWFLTALFIIAVFFSMFGLVRVLTEDTTKIFNSQEQPEAQLTEKELEEKVTIEHKINSVPKWVRTLNGESVTGHIVLSKIMEYTESEGYMGGSLHQAIFSTVLPGEQISPRMKVTQVVNSLSVDEGKYITRPTRTTTPTYIGQLFLDGGYFLVIIGFFLYGTIISVLYNQVKSDGIHTYQSVAFAFVMTVFTVSMHTGLLDLILLLMLAFVILTASIEKNNKNSSSES